jgi:hypothetical protein
MHYTCQGKKPGQQHVLQLLCKVLLIST